MTAATLIALDKKHLWHPFTQMRDWCAEGHEPVLLTRGKGAWLWDQHGNSFLDGNSSIWTNIHGHGHPKIAAALREQFEKLDHGSFLGFTNEPAIRLAAELSGLFPAGTLSRVFFSDDGSTAVECALKMCVQHWQLRGQPQKCEFLAFDQGYHGDTLGASSLGAIPTFHGRFQQWGFRVHHVQDAEALPRVHESILTRLAGVVVEPLIQGAAGMRLWPPGMLRTLRQWCDFHDIHLIFDEVMTGFGRTGRMFACEHEEVVPDFLALAKGLSGGVMPLAATLTTEPIFEAFLGHYAERKTFYYGHSYCGNALGCAAALANLAIFREEQTLAALPEKISHFDAEVRRIQEENPRHVSATRRLGLIAGIDVRKNASDDAPYPWSEQIGAKICVAARKHRLLTRPIGDTLVLMPPLCVTAEEISLACKALSLGIREVTGQ